jgi:hypothetical protein
MKFNVFFKLLSTVFVLISISSCQKDSENENITFIDSIKDKKDPHISHTRLNTKPGMIDSVTDIDYKKI